MSDQFEGGCLCGSVRYRVGAAPLVVGDCYCIDCRRSSGTSHCTHAAFPAEAFSLQGMLHFYDKPADSGNLVRRGFCPECGSPVYSSNSAMPQMVFVRVSSLDDPNRVAPQMTVYASRAPAWAHIDRSHPVFAGMVEGGPDAVLANT